MQIIITIEKQLIWNDNRFILALLKLDLISYSIWLSMPVAFYKLLQIGKIRYAMDFLKFFKSKGKYDNERLLSGGNVSMGFSSPWVTENLSKSRGEAEWFGRNFLSRVVRKNLYSHFRSDNNHIVENYKQQSKTCWNNQYHFQF